MSADEFVVTWRKNIFQLPKGASGKAFVAESSNLMMHGAIAVMPNLLLQKTSTKAKSKENKETLERRLEMWKMGKIYELVREGDALKNRLPKLTIKPNSFTETAKKRFKNLVVTVR